MSTHVFTEDEVIATRILQMYEIDGNALRHLVGGRVWTLLLGNGTTHVLVERPDEDTVFCTSDDCPDKPVCPAVVRFCIRRARQSVGDRTTINHTGD
jgi:hypothetical protein